MSFTVRDYRAGDFETLWRIDQECFPPEVSYSRMELKAYMRGRGSFTLVAADELPPSTPGSALGKGVEYSAGNAPVHIPIGGFIVAEAGNNGSGHVITIDVVAPARRSGLGTLLLRAAENRLRSTRCRSVELETAVDNVSALSFYKRHGYDVIRVFPRYYSNGVDALALKKDLI